MTYIQPFEDGWQVRMDEPFELNYEQLAYFRKSEGWTEKLINDLRYQMNWELNQKGEN